MTDFIDQIKVIGEKVARLKDQIQTEEATKNAFIMPFIAALDYDVFNPMEVVPEYVADIGIKKGEKVDYCIFKDGTPVLIVECKWHGEKLNVHNSQLHRYFHVTHTRFALLTNGIVYRFYTDLEEPNKMDENPFLEFNITDLKENLIGEIKKFHKSAFNVDEILNSASELKYSREVRSILSSQLVSPSEPFVKYFAGQVYNGRLTPKVMDQFTSIVRNTFAQLINDSINDRLKSALSAGSPQPTVAETTAQTNVAVAEPVVTEDRAAKVVTTQDEIEAFFIIKSILRGSVRSQRITYRDAQSYFAIFMDDNNRRPVCRLYLEGRKHIGMFDADKKETRIPIDTLEDIYTYSQQLVEAALRYPDEVKV
mgnify:CR=1 FL=1